MRAPTHRAVLSPPATSAGRTVTYVCAINCVPLPWRVRLAWALRRLWR